MTSSSARHDAEQRARLTESQRAAMVAGEHESLAAELAPEQPALAAWVFEQIWAFARAADLYAQAEQPLDALRMALEIDEASALQQRLSVIESRGGELARKGAAMLSARRRHADAARLLRAADADAQTQADALSLAGDSRAAARTLFDSGDPRLALDALGELREGLQGESWGLAAQCWWLLGDAEQAARHAQRALRAGAGAQTEELRRLLSASLEALGHPDAAEVALSLHVETADAIELAAQGDKPANPAKARAARADLHVERAGGHGRYHVRAVHPAPLAGSAYLALDRVDHREVEVHLLLADQVEAGPPDLATTKAVSLFVDRAESVAALKHPALRPVLRAEARAGLLVLPRAEGPLLRTLIRPPGLKDRPARARGFVAFMLEGLAQVHRIGFAHGGVLPHLIATDALGRPQLGPAGVDTLSGLAATRTGGLEELLTMTAPELHRGAPHTPASDVYSVGRIWAALLAGSVSPDLEDLPEDARKVIEAMTRAEPSARPSALELLGELRRPVRDLRELSAGQSAVRQRPGDSGVQLLSDALSEHDLVEPHGSWSEEAIAELCLTGSPWFQTIARREGRSLWLARWTESCEPLTAQDDRDLDPRAFDGLSDELADLLQAKVRDQEGLLVKLPGGQQMLDLSALLGGTGDAP